MKGAGFIVCLGIVLCSMVRAFNLEAPGLVICRCILRHEDCVPSAVLSCPKSVCEGCMHATLFEHPEGLILWQSYGF